MMERVFNIAIFFQHAGIPLNIENPTIVLDLYDSLSVPYRCVRLDPHTPTSSLVMTVINAGWHLHEIVAFQHLGDTNPFACIARFTDDPEQLFQLLQRVLKLKVFL